MPTWASSDHTGTCTSKWWAPPGPDAQSPIDRATDAACEAQAFVDHDGRASADASVTGRRGEWRHRAAAVGLPATARGCAQAALGVSWAGETGLGLRGRAGAASSSGADLLQVDLVAVEVEAQVLLHPQHVADQRRALGVVVVLAGQPHEGGDCGEEERPAEVGQVLEPASPGGWAENWASAEFIA